MAEDTTPKDTLRKEIVEQSRREAESIVELAQKEAEEIVHRGQAEAEKILKSAEHRAESEREQIQRRILSSVRLEIQKQSLRQREDLIAGILERVKKRLHDFRITPDYKACLEGWIVQGAGVLGADKLFILAGDAEKKVLDQKTASGLEKTIVKKLGREVSLEISGETLDEAGIVLRTGDGRMRLDNRLSVRMKRLDEILRLAIMKQLSE